MKLHGWIIYNGNLPGDQFLDFAEWLQTAANEQNIRTTIYKNNELLAYLTSHSLTFISSTNKELPDFVIFTDKDIYLAKQLELLGVRVFNSAQAIDTSDDKIATYQMLAQEKLPIPNTIIAPKLFGTAKIQDINFITYVIKTLGFPMIIKEAYGSFGEQVYLIQNKKEMIDKIYEINGKAFIFQEFIESSYGTDLRLHVVGDQVVSSMKRRSKDDFRANITAGGKMQAYEPNSVEAELAVAATKAIHADFAGVDLLFGPNGTPIICEVNSNAHIRNMFHCTGINVADYIIQYIVEVLNNVQE